MDKKINFPKILIFFSILFLFQTCSESLILDVIDDVVASTTISAPQLTGSALTNDSTPTWSWEPVPDATHYRFGYALDQWIEEAYTSLSFTPASALEEGQHSLFVQAGKDGEIWSETAVFAIAIDLTPPTAPTVSGQTPTNDTTPLWSWNENSDIVLYRYGFSESSWISENSESLSYMQSSVLAEGEHSLLVQGRDAAGNWSSSGSFAITIDLSALSAPQMSGSSYTNDTTPTWDWDDVADAVAYRYGFTEGIWISETATESSYTSPDVLSEDEHILFVQAQNSLGTWSASGTLSLIIDTTAPEAPAVSGISTTSDRTPSWDWNDVSGASLYRYGFSESSWISEIATDTQYIPASDLAEGDHTLYVQAGDEAGNWSDSGSFQVTIDLSIPESPEVTGSSLTNDTTPTWDWNDVTGAVAYRYGYAEGTWITESGTASEYTEISPLSVDDDYTLYVQAQNAAGTWSASGFHVITLDTAPPLAPVVTATSPTNDSTPTWSWNDVTDAVLYRYGYSESTWLSENATATDFTPSSALTEDTHSLFVQAADSAGNWSESGYFNVQIDLTAPVITGFTSSNTVARNHTWTWDSADTGAQFRYTVNTLSDEISDWSGISWDMEKFFSYDGVTGTYYLHLQAKDDLGNLSAQVATYRIFDNTPPSAPAVTGDDTTGSTRPTWTWDVPADTDGFRYRLEDSNSDELFSWVTVTSATTSYQPAANSRLSEDSYTLYVQAADDLGNYSASGSKTITVDISPPTTPSPVSGTTNIIDLTHTLDWEDLSHAGMYHIQINDQADFAGTFIADDSGVDQSQYDVASGLSPGNTYYWRVKTQNSDGDWGVDWSSTWSFATADVWAMSLGASGNDSANYIMDTSDGGLIMAGYTYSYGTGGDLWVVKTDAMGAVEWQKSIGGDDDADYAFAIDETSDGGFVIAGNGMFSSVKNFFHHPWIVKLSSAGVVEEEKLLYGTYGEEIYSIKQTGDGGYILVGFSPDHGVDAEEAWITKLDSDFAVTWSNSYGSNTGSGEYSRARAVAMTSDGGYIVAGNTTAFTTGGGYEAWIMKLTSTGTVSWAKCYDRNTWDDIFYDVIETGDGDFVAVGTSKISGSTIDGLIARFSSTGTMEWIENIGGAYEEGLFSVEETSTGDLVVAGFNDTYAVADNGTDDGWLLKLSSTGSITWQKGYGPSGSSNDFFNGAALLSSGNVIVAGYTDSYGEGGKDAWILRVDSSGDCSTIDYDTTATIKASGTDFAETTTTVTVTSASPGIGDTSNESVENVTTAVSSYQVP